VLTRRRLGVAEDELLIGLVARYHPIKDHATFLTAAGEVARSHPQIRVLVIGRGCGRDNRDLAGLVRRAGIEQQAILLDEWEDTSILYPALDILCLTSLSEGFPNTIGEAMACGVPCVTTAVGDCGYLVGPYGKVVPPQRPDVVAHALLELLRSGSASRAEMGAKARARIMAEFSLQAFVSRHQAMYEMLLGGSEPTSA
jgi:glycosyltransferase involved in cell wall biosynthesis